MRKQLITYLLLFITVIAFAQKKPQKTTVTPAAPAKPQKMTIHLTNSQLSIRLIENGADLLKVYKGTFEQKFSVLQSDSSYVHPATNTFDAFGHVVITQGDTLHIYADNLTYDDNTKIAVLTNHVRMVDKDAVLTTNFFTYNTATKIGTYTNGGKLVNKDNVLVSQTGYYYAGTRDAYFRYNVVMTSPDALIKTDTLRYNSGTRISYFYGPTHIYGKKDKDTLYTENGTYNTKTEQAFFGKKNRYSQGTKSLKGDSLFYDKLKGYGKAIKNITFEDTEQKMILKGNLGEYFKADDKAVITLDPYVIFVTEDKDTTKADTIKKIVALPLKQDSASKTLKAVISKDGKTKIALPSAPQKLLSVKADSIAKVMASNPVVKNAMPLVAGQLKDSVKIPAQLNAVIPKGNIKTPPLPSAKQTAQALKTAKPLLTDTGHIAKALAALKDTTPVKGKIKRDTMYIGADTLETQVVTYKFLKDLQEQRRIAGIRDTSVKLHKPFVPDTKQPKVLSANMPQLIKTPPDFKNRPLFAKIIPPVVVAPDTLKSKKKPVAKVIDIKKNVPAPKDTITAKTKKDSTILAVKPLSDTARVRILSAHHNVHIFKSDLQGKSDSLFYSSSDSVIRSFVKPMYWSQGAQLSGDTIYLQLKNKKADNLTAFPSAFVVHIENGDSTHFNQMGGKRLLVNFTDSKISRMVMTGNAETIYYNRNKGKITEMQRSISNRILANFKKGELANVAFTTKDKKNVYPTSKIKDDDRLLKNFIWKPKDRPANKEAVIHPKKPVPDSDDTKKGAAKLGAKKTATGKTTAKDSTGTAKPALKPGPQLKKDSTSKIDSLKKMPDLKVKKDSVKAVVKS